MAKRRPFDTKLLGLLAETRETLKTLEESRSAGEKALQAQRWTEARRAWERVLSILPGDAEASQNHNKATEEEARVRAARIRTMVKLGALAAVGLAVLTVVFIGYSNRGYVEWGKEYLRSGHPVKALEEFEKAGTFLVNAAELAELKHEAIYSIHMQDGDTARANREWGKAKAAYREAASLGPGTGEASAMIDLVEACETMEVARKLGEEMNYEEAVKSAKGIADMKASPGEPSDFARIRDEAREAIGKLKSSWLAGACELLSSQKYLASSVRLRKILAEFPEDNETLKLLTRCRDEWLTHVAAMRSDGKWDDALLECQRMRVAFPDDACVTREVDITKSERCLQKARSQFELGDCHEALSTIQEAEEWMRGIPELLTKGRALAATINAVIDSKYNEHMTQAKESAKKGKFEEARGALQQAMRFRKTEEAESLAREMADRLATPAGMVYIPAGDCIVGDSTQQLWKREGPAQKVSLSAFYIDRVPVTNAEYMKFVKATGHRMPAHWANAAEKIPEGKENHPVTHVNITDAEAYAKWAKKRLPTEAEWEKAARGPDGLKYPWGNVYKAGAANDENAGRNDTSPVGEYPAGKSSFGCLDMAGNVWEWTNTKFHLYPGSVEKLNKEEMESYVAKGGCFLDDKLFLRCSFRETVNPASPYATRATLGFRRAADVKR
jgi:sulfatase modifying factor 1